MASAKAGKLILILGPSGSGKGTIINYLKKKYPHFTFPCSYTTRKPRPGEKDGDAYHFISKKQFKQLINTDVFLEWAIVHSDNYYGTNRHEILDSLNDGQIVVREVDVQGVESIWKILGKENVITVFVTTPSWLYLKHRIVKRSKISQTELRSRERSYGYETKFASSCTHVVESLDDKIPETFAQIDKIISMET